MVEGSTKGKANVSDSLSPNAGTASHELVQVNAHFLVVGELSIHQERAKIGEEFLRLVKVNGDNFRNEVRRGMVLEMLKLKELLVKDALVEQ